MTNFESSESSDYAPVVLVRTIGTHSQIEAFGLGDTVDTSAQLLKAALGERSATLISPSGERTLGTVMALAYQLAKEQHHIDSPRLDLELLDVMNSTQFEHSPHAVRKIMTEAALRGVWSLEGDNGLVIVTSEYPIKAVLNTQERAQGLAIEHLTREVKPGQVVLVDPNAIGYEEPERPTAEMELQELPKKGIRKWLDNFRLNPDTKS